jgi:hypothetical protein
MGTEKREIAFSQEVRKNKNHEVAEVTQSKKNFVSFVLFVVRINK